MKKFASWAFVSAMLAALTACQSPALLPPSGAEDQSEIVLQEGDTLRVTFPGAPNLDSPAQPIRRDGKITLGLVGEVEASGITPHQLQDKLLSLYSGQLVSKEIVVTVATSSFSVYVDGPVQRPGKITSNHPLSVLEAIMEAGGFDYAKADTKAVQIIRHLGKAQNYTYYTVNLNDVIKGKRKDLFYLAPGDIVHVSEKFSLF